MERRFDYIDIAKGIGIMLVVMGHIEYDYVPFCGSVHIPLFFLLSGYLYDINKKPDRAYGSMVAKRVTRLLIPYFVYNIVLYIKYILKLVLSHTFTVKLGVNGFLGFVYSSALFYKNVPAEDNFEGFVFGNGPLWFLTAMAVSSVVFYFVVYFVLKHQYDEKKIIVSAAVLCCISWCLCRFLPVYLPWSAEMGILGAVFMLMGMCIRKQGIVNKTAKNYLLVPAFAIVFLVLHLLNGSANMAIQDYGKYMSVFIVLGFLGSMIVIWLSVWMSYADVINRFFSYLGRNTLIILAFHMTIISLMVSALGKLHLDALLNWGGFFIIRFVVGIAGSLIIYEILTRFIKVPKKFL